MSDEEWAVFEPILVNRGSAGARPPQDHRRVLDGVFWIARTGAPWRDLPAEFGNWNSVWRQFRRWCLSDVWDLLLEAFADSGGEAHDVTVYASLMELRDSDPAIALMDKGYDAEAIRQDLRDRGARPEIPTKRNRKIQHSVSKQLYALRSRIECCIGHLKEFRRIATRNAPALAGRITAHLPSPNRTRKQDPISVEDNTL